MLRWGLLVLLAALCSPAASLAADGDDFFAMDEKDITEYKEKQDEEAAAAENPQQQEWLKMLNKIRGKDEEEAKSKNEIWNEFEDISGTDAEKAYLNSREVQIKRELNKPLPGRDPFGGRIDELEDAVNSLRAPNVNASPEERN